MRLLLESQLRRQTRTYSNQLAACFASTPALRCTLLVAASFRFAHHSLLMFMTPAEHRPVVLYSLPMAIRENMDCLSMDALSNVFCIEDTHKNEHLDRIIDVVGTCEWSLMKQTLKDPGAAHAIFMNQSSGDAVYVHWWSLEKGYASTENVVNVPDNDLEYRDAIVERCESRRVDGRWTIERMKPLRGNGGHDWHSFGWQDAGGFQHKLREGDVWITSYAFLPMDELRPLGVPPIHIHHEHVTSGQLLVGDVADSRLNFKGREMYFPATNTLIGRINSWGTTAVEFDVHGDRQCVGNRGGVACLPIAMPTGFGMKLVFPMRTFGDLNDVRPENSPTLSFSFIHAYRWTRNPMRQVGRLVTGVSSIRPYHDTNLLVFDPTALSEYMVWQEFSFAPYNLTIFRSFWHTHHEYTADQWLIKGTTKDINLDFIHTSTKGPMSFYANLTANDLTIEATMLKIQGNLQHKERSCLFSSCVAPRILCHMDQKRWEDVGHLQERKVMPECDAFNLQANESVTLIGFHKALKQLSTTVWQNQHTAWYAYYMPMNVGEVVPHMIYGMVLPGTIPPLSGH